MTFVSGVFFEIDLSFASYMYNYFLGLTSNRVVREFNLFNSSINLRNEIDKPIPYEPFDYRKGTKSAKVPYFV